MSIELMSKPIFFPFCRCGISLKKSVLGTILTQTVGFWYFRNRNVRSLELSFTAFSLELDSMTYQMIKMAMSPMFLYSYFKI